MKENLLGLKEELKQLADNIRKTKPEFKETQRRLSKREGCIGFDCYNNMIYNLRKLSRFKYEFRHKHIVYCQLRGRKREQIEIPRECNHPNEKYIDELMEQYGKTLCVSA